MKTILFSAGILLLLFVFFRQKTTAPALKSIGSTTDSLPAPSRGMGKMNGLTLVSPPEPYVGNPMVDITNVGANWIAVVPYAFTRPDVPNVRYNENGRQWWGERPVGVRESIRLAKTAGINVMLKPQVWIPGGWTGALDFATDASWADWESSYEQYILRFAALADTVGVEMFCIGTEFNTSIQKRPQFWTALIKKIKAVYHGKLTYSANWDDWDRVPFWNELDYIGLGGYFPLLDAPLPSVEALKAAWTPIRDRLKSYSETHRKPVLFTEWGYLSVDGCGWRNWELEQGIENRNINEQAQANCMEAMLATFQPESWWAGSFLWKWFPNMRGHEGYPERDYTPQGKLAEGVLGRWYR
jgi:hypothetical protein